MVNGKPVVADLHSSRWCSTTEAQPVEVEPGVFDLVTNTSIYRLRLLEEEEVQTVVEAAELVLRKELEMQFGRQTDSDAAPAGQGMTS